MSDTNRREFLKGLLGNLARAAGTVVVVSAAVSTARSEEQPSEATPPAEDVKKRADRLAATCQLPAEEAEANAFLNGAFRNGPLGGFRNGPLGGFRNTPLGAFRNTPVGNFRNTPLGSFGNGGWPNGVWGGFRNGGWPNMGWRNWW